MNFQGKKVIDISPEIREDIAVFPGDTPFQRDEILSFEKSNNLVLSSIKTTVHLGAHTDAPSHYHKDGVTMEKVDLSNYLGECQIIEISEKVERIKPEHFEDEIKSPRILFKTTSFPYPYQWNDDFTALSPELIQELKKKNVLLVGIDTPSVDPASDKELKTHNAVYQAQMSILEGVVLKDVVPGIYQLLALPLPIKNGDASPVRAILIEE
jgi:arylformamidase